MNPRLLPLLLSIPLLLGADLPRVPVSSEVEVQQWLDRVKRQIGNATIVTTDPNGSRRGRYGDQVAYRDGTTYRLCTNTSGGPDGGTVWSCDLLTDTGLCFEGTTSNDFETCLAITDPTADRTVTLPNTDVNLTATAPGLTLSTTNAAGSASTLIRTDATVAAFDTTVPVTQAFGDAAATGSAAIAARRDHKHGMMSRDQAWIFVETITLSGTSTAFATLPTTSDVFMVVLAEATGSSGLELELNDVTSGYAYVELLTATWTDRSSQANIRIVQAGSTVSGEMLVARLGANGVSVSFAGLAHGRRDLAHAKWGGNTGITTLTKIEFIASSSMSGKAHLYRLATQ